MPLEPKGNQGHSLFCLFSNNHLSYRNCFSLQFKPQKPVKRLFN